jgi:hypothetical protein
MTANTDNHTKNRMSARLIYNERKQALAQHPHRIFGDVIARCNTPVLKDDLLHFACSENNMPLFKAALDSGINPSVDYTGEGCFISYVVNWEDRLLYGIEALHRCREPLILWQNYYGTHFLSTILREGKNEAALRVALNNCTKSQMARAFVMDPAAALKHKRMMVILIENDLVAWLRKMDKYLDVRDLAETVKTFAERLKKISGGAPKDSAAAKSKTN